ncbi:cytochrome P450 CYP749A22-like [Andrographis paniculata]|uniref:cytochrome P450 CYP749A22-like n=1 Tax=Andrographis paniculata TaxID=175694 RepID=UPI0021E86730|nr:cytochrome P450 CYP749A22-like [Andrographis paniculata]
MGAVHLMLLLLILVLLSSSLAFLYKFWWGPRQFQRAMKLQGIRGPSYRLFHGTNKEAMEMKDQARKSTMDLSHDIFPKTLPHLHAWIQLYGSVFLNWFGTQPQIVVSDPDLIREILTNKDGAYPKTRTRYFLKKLLGDGLVVAEGDKWIRVRKLANHAFHGDCLKDMFTVMVASVESMLEKWQNRAAGEEIDVSGEFKSLTSEVISRTAFGSSYIEGRMIFDLLTKLGMIISRNTLTIRHFVKTKDEIEADRIKQLLHSAVMKIVEKRENEMKSGESTSFGSDFLGSLLKAHHDGDQSRSISAEDIVDECKTFYFTGQDTTSALLSWTTLLLAIDTNWQEKARQEVVGIFGRDKPTSDGVAKLKIVNMILYESLRLYGPVSSIQRRIERKVKLGKFEFPADMLINIPVQALHQNPDLWGKDAHLFRPERFTKGLAKATDGIPTAFLGFGFGPRMCVGMNFAINEAKIALSMILQRYKFTLSPNYVHAPDIVLTTQPSRGVQILLQTL